MTEHNVRVKPLATFTHYAAGGAGLKHEHACDIFESDHTVDFFEVHAENYMGAGGRPHALLQRIRSDYPVSIHGVGLSIGAAGPLDPSHLARLHALVERYQPAIFSEHLAWSTHEGAFFNDLLPIPYNQEALAYVSEHVDQVQHTLGIQMLLENPSTYVALESSTMSEIEFLQAVVRRTGCALLLDVNNAFVSATNHGFDPVTYINSFPVQYVGEIHLAGFAEDCDADGGRLLIDAHGSRVGDVVWSLYRRVMARVGPVPTLIEWDNDVPPFPVLAGEVARAKAAMNAHASQHLPDRRISWGPIMYNLAIAQKSFAAALFDTCAPIPVSLRDAQRRRTESCFAIYRNNVAAGLIQSISSRYPLVRRLAGEDSFRAVAYRYILCEPPRSPVLLHYGETFPRFLRSLGPEPSIAYLAEIAELEMARVKAYHAPDVSPVSREWFSALPQDHLDTICIALHPSVTLLAARFPIVTIWEANQGDKGDGAIRKWGAEDALVARPFLDVNVWRLPRGAMPFWQDWREDLLWPGQ